MLIAAADEVTFNFHFEIINRKRNVIFIFHFIVEQQFCWINYNEFLMHLLGAGTESLKISFLGLSKLPII